MELKALVDRGGQRVIEERRFFQYGVFLPDNRSWKDRRGGFDRRTKPRYTFCDETIKLDNDKSEKVLFQIPDNINSDSTLLQKNNASPKSPNQEEIIPTRNEYQSGFVSEPPKHWRLQDPFDEIYLSELLRRHIDENAYIVYCIDTYNTYRLTDEQKTKFELFDNTVLNDIRANMYARNDLIEHFKQS